MLSRFFPNILKVLAWFPRTYLAEFITLLPGFVSEATCIEMMHTLLDLPCLSAALEQTRSRSVSGGGSTTSGSPINAALLNYILRGEGGLGGTIDRLGDLYTLLQPCVTAPNYVATTTAVEFNVWVVSGTQRLRE